MLSYPEALEYQVAAAQKKTKAATHIGSYTIASMLGGAYVGIGVVVMLTAAGPFFENNDPAVKLISGIVFSAALSLVLVAGAELVTSNMMTLSQGLFQRRIRFTVWGRTLTLNFLGNLLGAVFLAVVVWLSGVTHHGTAAYSYLEALLTSKTSESIPVMFFRAILCNALVCLAIWSGVRLKSEVARLIMIFWCILAFVTSGFEHVVANMTTFTLGFLNGVPDITATDFALNMVVVGAGNLVGGSILVGLTYVVLARAETRAHAEEVNIESTPAVQADAPPTSAKAASNADSSVTPAADVSLSR
ncbi:formate/nitrite transporter family protein [Jonesia quinghaiensis]|uniref:formate/nitrite transporter family protein n=1 Tax=Jonesia quinghaiensis TaxID=262806 RepID=UPI0003F611A4|nr:formate/nitrite transporter family protein [Jonesia quinghaiensis]